MNQRDILKFFKGPEGRKRRAKYLDHRQADDARYGFGADFKDSVRVSLNYALMGVDGWDGLERINANTADAVAYRLEA